MATAARPCATCCARNSTASARRSNPKTACVATLSYVYNHHERELAERLMSLQHEHHDLTVSAMHAHLDHDHCIETVILRGPAQAVRRFADGVIAERGVRHGALNLIVAEPAQSTGMPTARCTGT